MSRPDAVRPAGVVRALIDGQHDDAQRMLDSAGPALPSLLSWLSRQADIEFRSHLREALDAPAPTRRTLAVLAEQVLRGSLHGDAAARLATAYLGMGPDDRRRFVSLLASGLANLAA